jgi:membrane-associated protein
VATRPVYGVPTRRARSLAVDARAAHVGNLPAGIRWPESAAGASGLELRRYLPRSFVASTIYTLYHVAIGAAAGFWFAVNPLIAALVAVAVVFVLGFGFDAIARLRRRSRELRPSASE